MELRERLRDEEVNAVSGALCEPLLSGVVGSVESAYLGGLAVLGDWLSQQIISSLWLIVNGLNKVSCNFIHILFLQLRHLSRTTLNLWL